MTSKHQCRAQVYHSGDSMSSKCSRAGVVEREGKWYCRQHDPVAVKAKADAWYMANEKKWKDAEALRQRRQRHERIGRLVMGSVEVIKALARATIVMQGEDQDQAAPICVLLETILDEVKE